MKSYLLKRILLLPVTLFFIIVINFIIINLAPGEPTTITDISEQGATRRADSVLDPSFDRYLQFREFYGLSLPILFNTWPFLTYEYVYNTLTQLIDGQYDTDVKDFDKLKVKFGDQARFVMPHLLRIMNDQQASPEMRKLAFNYFKRGTFRLGTPGASLTREQRERNRKIADDYQFLSSNPSIDEINLWYEKNSSWYQFQPDLKEQIAIAFTQTRFFQYMRRVLTLDFGVMRNDPNKTVISEVVKRFKYSLTLAVIPLIITFFLCLVFGFIMAFYHNYFVDYSLNIVFLILYALPVFVAAPFLIEKVALNNYFPFTNTPIPLSGFTSPDAIYKNLTTSERLIDILKHIALPMIAILYGSLAAQARLSRTAVLEVMRQDYVRTAYVKGVPKWDIALKHIGRNAAITIITSIAGSLGIVLGGSLIVETLFEIDGFGKFFYDAILNRDYNVIMFSAIAGSFLTLLGYITADIAYMLLDPRVKLDE